MLILSRKLGEKIVIDGGIQLEVLEVSGNRVRLGILAPDDCRIARAERHPSQAPRNDAARSDAPRHADHADGAPQKTPGGDTGPLRQVTKKSRNFALPVCHKPGSLPVRG